MRFRFVLFCFLAAAAAAQTVKVSDPLKDSGTLVTLQLSYQATDADFKPADCHWYSYRQGALLHVHDGCDSFTREFSDGPHFILLVANGKSPKLEGNDQRSDVAVINVQPRVKTEHTKFRPEDLAAMEAAAKKK